MMNYQCTLWLIALITPLFARLHHLVHAEQLVPCFFVFGDSLVDNGNSNNLKTSGKANYGPYGIDFPDGPTGRFCNGRNLADILAEYLGFERSIPPFVNATGQDLLAGVNYGCGGAGILDETGQNLGERFSMNRQIINHITTVSRITSRLKGVEAASNQLKSCIYAVVMGNNDYINNYLISNLTRILYTPKQFATRLTRQLSQQLRTLFRYGARKVAVFGPGLVGCTPSEVATYGTNGSLCVDSINSDIQPFNDKLKVLVEELNRDLRDANFTFINMTGISSTASFPGITVPLTPCCDTSMGLAKGQCTPNSVPCADRNMFVFWDGFHPTEASNMVTTARAYSAESPLDAYPVDIRHLAEL